ncbi:hypothetical protein BGZ90_006169, partial [Linnemannia elongata]
KSSAPITPPPIHPQPSNHPTRSAADLFSHSITNPSGHHPYQRFEDPNRPAPEFPSRIESFTGNQLTLDLDEYLSGIELHFINKSCPENKVSSFVSLLKSGARQWAEQYLESLSPSQAIEWAPFKAAFRARWRVTHLTTNLRAEIEVLRRGPNEALASFAARYLALANRIPDRSDKDKRLDFARKLPSWLQGRISDLHNEDDRLDAFLHKVVAKEASIQTFEYQDGNRNGRRPYRGGNHGNKTFSTYHSSTLEQAACRVILYDRSTLSTWAQFVFAQVNN